jgi:hypothetical protein
MSDIKLSDELDNKARQMFGVPSYEVLSEFGKRDVRRALTSHESMNMSHIDAARALQAAQQKIATLERELKDAWDENEDLKLELLELNEDSYSGKQQQGQRKSRVRVDEALPERLADATRFRHGTNTIKPE